MPDVLHQIVEQARTGPDLPAVKDLETELSYAELADAAARLSAGLAAHGVKEGDRVALLLPNSVDFVVAALASLSIGAIFVPLSVADPEARLASIVADCTPALVIRSDEATKDGHAPLSDSLEGSPVLPISVLRDRGADLPGPVPVSPRVAYAIYTSGTTGAPKGVLIGGTRHSEPRWRRLHGRSTSTGPPARSACPRSTLTDRSAPCSRPCTRAVRW